MSTKREGILLAIKAALTSVPGVADASVYRSRISALSRAESPAIVIEPLSDSAENPTLSRIQWTMLIQAVIIIRAAIIDQSADAIINAVHNKLMQSSAIDALVIEIIPTSVDWQIHDADVPLGMITMQFRVMYQTSLTDLSA